MPPETTGIAWSIAERFGFPAFVCVCLGLFIWYVGLKIISELGLLTRAVALCVLAMQFAPKLHEAAEEIYDESAARARKRKEDMESETKRHHK